MPQERYTLNILKETFALEVDRTVFDSMSFAAIPTNGESSLATRQERKSAQVQLPLTLLGLEIDSRGERAFPEMCKVFESGKIRLDRSNGEKMTVAKLREAAKYFRKPEQSLNQAFDSYAQEHFGRSYSDLIRNTKKAVITRFHVLFDNTVNLQPMEMTHDEHVAMRENFTHYPIWTSPEFLNEYCELADQGHVYSQYLAGVLLATVAGGFSKQCVRYLIMAYENKVPDAMAVLAEFCFLERDYFGAVQCALLSAYGGHVDSERLIRKCYGLMGMKVYQAANGIVFGNQVLTQALHESGYGRVIERLNKTSSEAH